MKKLQKWSLLFALVIINAELFEFTDVSFYVLSGLSGLASNPFGD